MHQNTQIQLYKYLYFNISKYLLGLVEKKQVTTLVLVLVRVWHKLILPELDSQCMQMLFKLSLFHYLEKFYDQLRICGKCRNENLDIKSVEENQDSLVGL